MFNSVRFMFDINIAFIFSEVNLSRHIACEVCDATVTGGYDIENNQVNEHHSIIKIMYFFCLSL